MSLKVQTMRKPSRDTGEIGSTDDGGANAKAEPDTAAVVHAGRIDVAFEWHHFAGIQKGGHLQVARRVPPMLDTDVGRVVVAKAVSAKAAEVIVAAQNGLEINRDLIPLFGECQYDGRPDRDDATLVEIGNVLLELVPVWRKANVLRSMSQYSR